MKFICFAVSLIISTPIIAAERFEVTESIDINASAAAVWDVVKGFDNLHGWHPAFSNTELTEGDPTLRGAMRVLTIGDNAGSVTETLTAYNADEMSLSYVINKTDAAPVKDYASTVKVLSVSDDLSLLIWTGNFLANPPEGEPDSMSRDTIAGLYRAGLENVKKMLEGQ